MPRLQPVRDIVLNALPGTQVEIRIKTGLAGSSVCRWLEQLHRERCAYIEDWLPPRQGQGGRHVAVWVAGDSINADRPKVRNDQQRMADVRARRKVPPPHPLMAMYG